MSEKGRDYLERTGEDDQSDVMRAATCLAINLCKALSGIAAAIDRQAEATVLLARATSGEFDEGEDVEPATDLTGRPLR